MHTGAEARRLGVALRFRHAVRAFAATVVGRTPHTGTVKNRRTTDRVWRGMYAWGEVPLGLLFLRRNDDHAMPCPAPVTPLGCVALHDSDGFNVERINVRFFLLDEAVHHVE